MIHTLMFQLIIILMLTANLQRTPKGSLCGYRLSRWLSSHGLVYLRLLQELRQYKCTFRRSQCFHRNDRFSWPGSQFHWCRDNVPRAQMFDDFLRVGVTQLRPFFYASCRLRKKRWVSTNSTLTAHLYAKRCQNKTEGLLALMKVGAWLLAKEVHDWGFVDEITELED